jgi:CheY-like chemotaxis protein
MRRLLARALREHGYRITQYSDGIDLVERLGSYVLSESSERFDLIISDVRMPGVTGLEALESMHQWKGFPPMILITAFGDDEMHARARRLGAAAMLDKPFDIEDLLATVFEIVPPRSTVERRLSAKVKDTKKAPME